MNLYAYAGNNPISYGDPFGLCATADAGGPDSVRIKVNVQCPDGSTEVDYTWAHKVKDPAQLKKLGSETQKLSGGSSDYTPGDVKAAYDSTIQNGNVYVYPLQVNGGTVTDGGDANADQGIVLFRQDVWNVLQVDGLGMHPVGCQVVGHEGVHLAQGLRGRHANDSRNDQEAEGIPWTCK